jgi:hypothetical protein
MSFESELQDLRQLKVNLVLKITAPSPTGVTYFSKYQVQSGLVVPSTNVGMVTSFSVPGSQIDLLSAKQDIGSATVEIVDKNNVFSTFMGQPLSALIGLRADLYVGLITDTGFAWSQYITEKQNYVIKTLDKRGNTYTIGLRSQQDRMQGAIYNFRGNLTTFTSQVATTMTIDTGGDTFKAATGLNPQRAKINKEFIQYTGKTYTAPITTLTGISRGDESSDAVAHKAGVECFFVEKVIANPIDLLLRLMMSTGFGTNGSYDVLFDGCAIPAADIDTASFLSIRNTFFPSDTFTLFFYNIPNALKYIEVEFLQANNVRFTEVNGKIGLAILDQSVPGDDLPIVNEDVITSKPAPSWKLSENRLFNSFVMEYFYNEGTETYSKTKQFDDVSSQSIHGIRTTGNLKFKGITTDGVAQERGQRLMDRFSSPQSEITCTQFLKTYNTPPGEKVTFTHRDLPSPGGGLGLNHELELLKKAINYATGLVQATYVFTSYINLRRGLIAPSSVVASVISSNQITVPLDHGVRYKVGYVLNLFSNVTHLVVDGINNVITDVTGDTITFANNFTGLAAGTTYLKFADYDYADDVQRAKYMYIVGGSGLFADGSGGYKIY